MGSSLKPGRGSSKVVRAKEAARGTPVGARGKGRLATSSACFGAFIGAAAALTPASCSSPETLAPLGGNAGATTTSVSNGGMGGMPTGTGGMGGMPTGTGGMHSDGGDASDGTIVDLDADADAPHVPSDSGKPDSDAS